MQISAPQRYRPDPYGLRQKREAKDCATSALRMLATQGHEALIMQTVEAFRCNPEVIDALRAMLMKDPLDRFPQNQQIAGLLSTRRLALSFTQVQ